MYHFKVLLSTAFIRIEDMTDDIWLSHKATWYESFGEADRVYKGIETDTIPIWDYLSKRRQKIQQFMILYGYLKC